MKTAYVVIGANFGDEAKGKTVDALVARIQKAGKRPLVCRFNGGGQAGHTVIVDDIRHVFSHVGAGALRGAPTYLSRHFIINFFTLAKELKTIQSYGKFAEVIICPKARVTMLADMLINEMIERRRGNNRHGSCGLGINETVTRCEAEGGKFSLTAHHVDLAIFNAEDSGIEELAQRMFRICKEWIPQRLYALGFTHSDITEELKDLTTIESLRKQAREMVDLVRQHVAVMQPEYISAADYEVVFEGAQGLMLDEFMGFFPHVTRSMTGLPNAIEAAKVIGVNQLIPIYTTRAYLTRHGAGPLSHEGEKFAEKMDIEDVTNKPNEWQGQIRYAPLNLALMDSFVRQDFRRGQNIAPQFNVQISNPQIALHCLDQIGSYARVYGTDSKPHKVPTQDLAQFIAEEVGWPVTITSDGPTADSVYFTHS